MSKATILIDWKSSNYYGPGYAMQLGGYCLAENILTADGAMELMPEIDYALCMRANFDGIGPRIVLNGESLVRAKEAYERAFKLYLWLKSVSDEVKEPRRYTIGDKNYVSVTEVGSYILDKPKLREWYASMARAGKDPNQFRDRAADKGSRIHKIIENWFKGKKIELDDETGKLVMAVEMLDKKLKMDSLFVEGKVFHSVGYAGTFDWLGVVDREALESYLSKHEQEIVING